MRPWLEESPGDVKKLSFSSRSVKLVSWVPRESEMVCASGSESCYFCALRSHQKKCVLRSGLHTRAKTVGPRETRPHGRSAQGFPNNFMSQTCKQMRAIEPTDCHTIQTRESVWESFCRWCLSSQLQFKLSIEINDLLYFG